MQVVFPRRVGGEYLGLVEASLEVLNLLLEVFFLLFVVLQSFFRIGSLLSAIILHALHIFLKSLILLEQGIFVMLQLFIRCSQCLIIGCHLFISALLLLKHPGELVDVLLRGQGSAE